MTGEQLREALDRLGLSQRELSRRLGVNASTVFRWATDEQATPQYAAAYLELALGQLSSTETQEHANADGAS